MGTQIIPDRKKDQIIDETFFDLLRSILIGDIVPRNENGVPTTEAGSGGTDTYRFLAAYAKSLNIGQVGSAKEIEEDGTDIIFNFNSVEKGRIRDAGFNYQLSSSCGADVIANLTVTITTYGKPVFVGLIADGTANPAYISAYSGAYFIIKRGAVELSYIETLEVPASALFIIDFPDAGEHVYSITRAVGGGTTEVQSCKLIAYELGI